MTIEAVVIGASVGGIEALSQLLPVLSADSRAAYLIVIHLPRHKPSLLIEVFAPRCPLPVREAEDKAPIEPGTVYFAPPDYHLLVDEGPTLALSVDDPVFFSRPSIDVLFQSAAEFYDRRLLGIILTGANEDGARGLAAVVDAGGSAIVQDPREAMAPALPSAACRLAPAAQVLTIEQIKDALRHVGR
jgi:two-component system chemotaxis response regulator CheB